jgi:polyisoprenoid-binding protein YceI
MKKYFIFLTAVIVAASGFKQGNNTVKRSIITFQVKNVGIATTGAIGGLQANVRFNPANLTASSIEASVDVNTINTDNPDRDEHLKSDDFFDVAHFPRITLKSISFRHKSGNNYTGQFTLTMKGKSKLVDIPFNFVDKTTTMELKGAFKINRLDFGVGENSLILSNEVNVNLDAEIIK